MSIQSINPATGEVIASYEAMDDAAAAAAVEAADAAFREWREQPIATRADCLNRAAALLRERSDALAALMAREMGKPLAGGRAEVDKCAWVCEYYSDNAERFLAPEPIQTDASESFAAFEPLGVVLAVMPWNFPLWQVFRFAAPALMAGNAGVLKHASNVAGTALAIEQLLRDAGCPEHLFRTLLISGSQVEAIVRHPKVMAATLTGSGPAGRAVAAAAGDALKKTVLELGGADAYVVLADADLDAAAETCAASRLINSGQSCIAAKRFVVVREVLSAFTARFVAAMQTRRLGDPFENDTDIGPMARVDLRDEVHRQVQTSVAHGARCLLGGEVPERVGAWYPPTVLTEVRPGMPAYDDEIFGPVAAIIAAEDEQDAIRIANDSPFGLGAAVFTRDVARGRRIAQQQLQAGACFVNSLVKSDPRLPFGGIKASGYGRELSHFGIREFVNIKTVYVA